MARNITARHKGMTMQKVTVNNKHGIAVTMHICAKNNTHDKIINHYLGVNFKKSQKKAGK